MKQRFSFIHSFSEHSPIYYKIYYCSWTEKLFGIPQGSILWPLLGGSLFVVKDIDIASYADDSTPFIVENNIDKFVAYLKQVSDFCLIGSKVIV